MTTEPQTTSQIKLERPDMDLYRQVYEQASQNHINNMIAAARKEVGLPENEYNITYMGREWKNDKNRCDYLLFDKGKWLYYKLRIPAGSPERDYFLVTKITNIGGIALTQTDCETKIHQESPRPKGELHKQQQQQQQMNTAKYANTPVSTVTLVFGQDVSELSPDNCISLISRYQAVKKDLAKTLEGTNSSYLANQVAQYDTAITTLVARLDTHGRASAPAPAPEA